MLKIKSSSEQIYDYIVHEIEIGNYESGKRLSESELMEIFGISRTPIREALIRLVADGIVDNNSRKGFFVKHLDRKDVKLFHHRMPRFLCCGSCIGYHYR